MINKTRLFSIIIALALLLLLSATTLPVPTSTAKVDNKPVVLNSFTCGELGGTWTSSNSTCTITSTTSLNAGMSLNIPSGVTLAIKYSGEGGGAFYNYGIVRNSGTIIVGNSGECGEGGMGGGGCGGGGCTSGGGDDGGGGMTGSTGFYNYGTLRNEGLVAISNSGRANTGIANHGLITNDGTMAISNHGRDSRGLINSDGGTVRNDGAITIDNRGRGAIGLLNYGLLTNDHTITIANGGPSTGIDNYGTLRNDGMITISNVSEDGECAEISTGFVNESSATIFNDGRIIDYASSFGFMNYGTLIGKQVVTAE